MGKARYAPADFFCEVIPYTDTGAVENTDTALRSGIPHVVALVSCGNCQQKIAVLDLRTKFSCKESDIHGFPLCV